MNPRRHQEIEILTTEGKQTIHDATTYRGFAWHRVWLPEIDVVRDLWRITHIGTGYSGGTVRTTTAARTVVDAYHAAWSGWDTLTEITDEIKPVMKAACSPTYQELKKSGVIVAK